ncbi:MAG: hypothetical protein WC966_10900, partial [Bradymonadales bacterium]
NNSEEPTKPTTKPRCIISGADEMRTGTSREYSVAVVDDSGGDIDIANGAFVWACSAAETVTHSISEDTKRLTVNVPKSALLSGDAISLLVIDADEEYEAGAKEVEVL